MLERNGRVTACRQIDNTGLAGFMDFQGRQLLVFERTGEGAKNRAKPEPRPTISVGSLAGSVGNLAFLLGCQGSIQKRGEAICILEGSVVPASGKTADRDVGVPIRCFVSGKRKARH